MSFGMPDTVISDWGYAAVVRRAVLKEHMNILFLISKHTPSELTTTFLSLLLTMAEYTFNPLVIRFQDESAPPPPPEPEPFPTGQTQKNPPPPPEPEPFPTGQTQ